MPERSKTQRRGQAILDLAFAGNPLNVDSLAQGLGVSQETVRRDLARLDRAGLLRRVHGGAVAVQPGQLVEEGAFDARMRQAVAAKRAIAAHVAAGLRAGESLFIDTGSTTVFLAQALVACKGLTVITNSARIASLAAKGEDARIIMLGGEFRSSGAETVGAATLAQIAQLRADHAILTVASVTAAGCYDIDPAEADIARAMVSRAAQVTVLADSSKFDRGGVFEVCALSQVTRLVTDRIPSGIDAAARGAGVLVRQI